MRFIFLLVMILGLLSPNSVFALESNSINVKIPEFNVWFNNVLINNINNKYPLIVFRDITYVPMTWNYSRFLGLQTTWNNETGLKVIQSTDNSGFELYDQHINNINKLYNAKLADFDIYVNNKEINNNNNKYPLIVFRDITYFPLTWRFAVDEFGWDYKWKAEEGLKITSRISDETEFNNIITILNKTNFNRNYDFKGTVKIGELESLNIEGNHRVEFRDINIGDYSNIEFRSKITLDAPFKYIDDVMINSWDWYYDLSKPMESSFSSISTVSSSSLGSRHLISDFKNHPITLINKYTILGDERKKVKEIKQVNGEKNTSNYIIIFEENSNIKNDSIEVEIDWEKLVLKRIKIKGLDEDYGLYSINLELY